MPTQEDFDALQSTYKEVVAQRDELAKSLDAMTAERDAYRDANLKNQTALDAEIQGRKDDADLHAQVVLNYKVAHEQVVALLCEPPDVRALRVKQAQELAELQQKLAK